VPDPIVALEILDLALVPGISPAIYTIGMAASRITIADQQRRAVNIIWALLREGRVAAGDRIAIVGGGVAGITAAAYALKQHLRATVFEKFDDPFAIQQGSGRWIHPNIYEWPVDGWSYEQTSLPCMNWRAGTAGQVVAQLRKEWLALVDTDGLEWKPRTEIVGVERGTAGDMLVDLSGTKHGPYSCLILAAGFGEEATRPEFDGKPYWRDDDLHQRLRSGGTALVSGCGDGGLIDAIRIALRDFQHEWLATAATRAANDPAFVSSLLRIERNTPAFPDGDALTKATLAITAPAPVTSLIKAQLRPNTSVILNAGREGPFTRAACLINRFIIAELIKLGIVTYMSGKLDSAAIRRERGRFALTIEGSTLDVDLIVVRHGPVVRPLAHFPAVDSALAPVRSFLRTYRAGVDRTRTRAWGPIPVMSAIADGTLPPLSGDVIEYLAQSMQNAVKDELARREIRAVVGYECHTQAFDLRVRIESREERIRVALISGTYITLTHLSTAAKPLTLSVTLAADVIQDSGSAVPVLAAKVPEILNWVVEE
jgi:hypothetical protein